MDDNGTYMERILLEKIAIALIKADVDYKLVVKDELVHDVAKVIQGLYGEGSLVLDYSRECGLKYIEHVVIDVDKIRKYWLKSYCGKTGYASTKEIVEKLLLDVMQRYNLTFEQCEQAAKSYIEENRNTEYLLKLENFILDKTGSSRLAAIATDSSPKKTVRWL